MRAKFVAQSVTNLAHGANQEYKQQEVRLTAVYVGENLEDNEFNQATPSGDLRMLIDNPAAFDFIKPGLDYYLDITEAPKR